MVPDVFEFTGDLDALRSWLHARGYLRATVFDGRDGTALYAVTSRVAQQPPPLTSVTPGQFIRDAGGGRLEASDPPATDPAAQPAVDRESALRLAITWALRADEAASRLHDDTSRTKLTLQRDIAVRDNSVRLATMWARVAEALDVITYRVVDESGQQG